MSQEVSPGEEDQETFAVTSRGRVRKVKKIINYDTLDFDKLATQAKQEEMKKKTKKLDELMKGQESMKGEDVGETDPDKLNIPACGVKRYLMSKTGQVMGFIDNEGRVHSGSTAFKQNFNNIGSSSTNNASYSAVNSPNTKTSPQNANTGKRKDYLAAVVAGKSTKPTVVVAAINDKGAPVYVTVVGAQAIELLKYRNPLKGPISQVKLQHYGETYTVNSNAHMSYVNIPGIPDSDTAKILTSAQKSVPTAASNDVNNSQRTLSPNSVKVPLHQKIASSVPLSSPGVRVPNVSSNISTTTVSIPYCSTPNTVALAYRGIQSSQVNTRPTISQSSESDPKHGATLTATTNLVSAIPNLVSSVSPYQTSSKIAPGTPVSNKTIPQVGVINTPTHSITSSIPKVTTPQGTRTATVISSQHLSPKLQQQLVNKTVISSVANSPMVQQVVKSQLSGVAVNSLSPNVQRQTIATSIIDQSPKKTVVQQQNIVTSSTNPQQQVQVKLGSDHLVQLIQKAGNNKIVAIPSGKGVYTLSMTPIASADNNNQSTSTFLPSNITVAGQNQQNVQISGSIGARPSAQLQIQSGVARMVQPQIQQVSKPQIIQESNATAVKISEAVPSNQPTRYILQPQILNQGIAPSISQQSNNISC